VIRVAMLAEDAVRLGQAGVMRLFRRTAEPLIVPFIGHGSPRNVFLGARVVLGRPDARPRLVPVPDQGDLAPAGSPGNDRARRSRRSVLRSSLARFLTVEVDEPVEPARDDAGVHRDARLPDGSAPAHGLGARSRQPPAHRRARTQLGLIRRILTEHPQMALLLVGDTGQLDPEIYATAARDNPDRIRAIYVRRTGRLDRRRLAEVDDLAAEITALGVPMLGVDDSVEIAEHAARSACSSRPRWTRCGQRHAPASARSPDRRRCCEVRRSGCAT
jgi:hypothetical protein